MIKKIFFTLLVFSCFLPIVAKSQNEKLEKNEKIFKARVVEIIDQLKTERDDGSISIKQKIKLKGIEGEWKDKEVIFNGMDLDNLTATEYRPGDKVFVSSDFNTENETIFYIVGFVRTAGIYWLAIIFALGVIIVGKTKGLRALLMLALTFLIILKFIIPFILKGYDPLTISILGSAIILFLTIYITEGINRPSTISIISIIISLLLTGILAIWFTELTKLSGFDSEESVYLISIMGSAVKIKGLLLSGIVIGALGVLDDIVIAQVSLVEELRNANSDLSKIQIYKKAMRVGISHLSSMVNTLFLAYAGAALPLLVLFSINEPPLLTFNQVINSEIIATEIVRTLSGSIGLILTVPLSTIMAIYFGKQKNPTL